MSDDPFDPSREAAGAPRPEDQSPRDPELEDETPLDAAAEWEEASRERARRERRRARKERVLHTRVSEQLSDDIRRAADDLRVPVSNLVRNVLEEAFGAVERVSEEVGDLLDEVLGEADEIREDLRRRRRPRRGRPRRRREAEAPEPPEPPAPPEPAAAPQPAAETRAAPGRPGAGALMTFPDVLGWQPLLVNGSRPCACGERTLEAGDQAYVAVTESGLSGSLLCSACMRARGGS